MERLLCSPRTPPTRGTAEATKRRRLVARGDRVEPMNQRHRPRTTVTRTHGKADLPRNATSPAVRQSRVSRRRRQSGPLTGSARGLLRDGCRSRRSACRRADPRAPASAPACRSCGGAATGPAARVAAGRDETRSSGPRRRRRHQERRVRSIGEVSRSRSSSRETARFSPKEQRGGSVKRLRRLCRGWSGLGLGAGLDGRDASGEREGDEREEREDGLRGAQPVDLALLVDLDDLIGGRGGHVGV